jgi:hypothetical protein
MLYPFLFGDIFENLHTTIFRVEQEEVFLPTLKILIS